MQKHLVIILWDLDFGGIQTRLEELLSSLLKQPTPGVKVTLLLKRRYPNRVKLPKSSLFQVHSFSQELYQGGQLQFGIWLLKNLWSLRPTHLLTFSNRFSCLAVLYKKLAQVVGVGVRVTISEEIYLSKYIAQYEKSYWRWIVSFFYRQADAILVLTKAMKADLVYQFKLPKEKIQIIPSWYDFQKVSPPHQEKKFDLLFVGRFAKEKRIDLVLALASVLRKKRVAVQVGLVGDGVEKAYLEELVHKNGLGKSVHFLGYKTKPEIALLFKQSRMLVLPSKNEGLPMIILEAAAHQLPVVAAHFPGVHEVIEQQFTGFIFDSISEFYAKVDMLLKDPKQLQTMGERAQQKVIRDFSLVNRERFLRVVLAS